MEHFYRRTRDLMNDFSQTTGQLPTPLSHCSFVRLEGKGESCPAFYTPSLCMVIEGSKTAEINGRTVSYSPGDALIASTNLPATTAIETDPDSQAFLGLQIALDFELLNLTAEQLALDVANCRGSDLFCLQTLELDPGLLNSIENYLTLIEHPDELKDLQNLRLQEIYIRLLRKMPVSLLFQFLREDNTSQRIHQTTDYIQHNLSDDICVTKLAALANMSVSAFHMNFKKVTRHSPLQYIKRLRLSEARKLMFAKGLSVSAAAYEVGYESPSQFSREYSRQFGLSPRADRSA